MKRTDALTGSRILSLGDYTPARIVDNDEICTMIDSSDDWIRRRSGIERRHVAGPDESVTDMAVHAGSKAVAAAGLSPSDIDLVVVATGTYPYQTPAAAAEVAHRIGIVNAGALDVSAGCAGFCYALAIVSDAVRAGSSTNALVIGSEKITEFIDPHDRGTSFLFGDGAGAAVVGASGEPGIGPVVLGSDGSQAGLIAQDPSYTTLREQLVAHGDPVWPTIRMEGQAVFRWAATELAPVAARALELAGLTPADLGAFVPHQANLRIVHLLTKALRLPDSVPVAKSIAYRGNTSAASIPLALHDMVAASEVASGEPALLVAFGAGLCFAAQVATVP
jgi:3-oxoacyl-[acyl-carrier-protein] synthase-3